MLLCNIIHTICRENQVIPPLENRQRADARPGSRFPATASWLTGTLTSCPCSLRGAA
ncbi:hypothetical protein FHT10_003141 [Xanthomonas arboricola]|nr:hypothetical protein [Xanthomonas cannabis]NIK18957.1 hypothetical protein [Xanthomonas cannabis]NIK63372.1 hypothetical protein [Xanthomonas cannabis]